MNEWNAHFLIWSKMTIDGLRIHGWAMRRKVKGQWQYRELTSVEFWDLQTSLAW